MKAPGSRGRIDGLRPFEVQPATGMANRQPHRNGKMSEQIQGQPDMTRVVSPEAPVPAGHYEQGWVSGQLVFVSGQLPINPQTEEKVRGRASAQALQCLNNVKAVLRAAGTDIDRVLKVTVFVSDIAMWDEINDVYATFFGAHKPARSVVPTRELHHGFNVEIEAIATF